MAPLQTPLPKIPLGSWVGTLTNWIQMHLHDFSGLVSQSETSVNDILVDVLLAIPPLVMVVVSVLIAWPVKSWRLAAEIIVTFLLIISVGQWTSATETLALVILAMVTALIFAIPLGVWATRNKYVSALVHPTLDLMQTVPAFVYLTLSVLFFSIGVVPGTFTTLIFVILPGVRMTKLDIKQMGRETVEAGRSFGATDQQILRGIQFPLAVPTTMTGVSQVVMLASPMVTIAGMVGADSLEKETVKTLATIDIAKDAEAGLSIAFLTILLDRVAAALGAPRGEDSPLSFLGKR